MTEFGVLPEELKTDTDEWLEITLKLKIKGKPYSVPTGNIKDVQLDCQLHGFEGSLSFWIPADGDREDKLLDPFLAEDLIELELTIKPKLPAAKKPPDPFTLKGLVIHKSLYEELYQQPKKPGIYYRHYQIRFADPAQALWTQHYPCELYVKQTMEDVFKKQLTAQITLEIKLPAMKTKQPMICLGLGLSDCFNNGSWHRHNQASFYDFTLDYVVSQCAYFIYDYKKNAYLLAAERPKLEKSKDFMAHEVNSILMHWTGTKRYPIQLLNSVADKPKKETLKNKLAVEGIRHDILLREPVSSKVEAFKKKAEATLKPKAENLSAHFSRWPIVTYLPGYAFAIDKKTWGKDPAILNKKYRTFRLQIRLESVSERTEYQIQNDNAGYKMLYKASMEPEARVLQTFPTPKAVAYPIQVEGKVVSTVGEEKDTTYDLEKNKDTQRDQYKVNIPLWDKNILILEEPDDMNTHFYFPHYRDTKLLLDMYLYEARIVKTLSWGKRVKLPIKTQGNHVLFGKNDKDETSMRHIYEGEKPALLIKRVKEKDNEHIKLKEGTLILETNWEEQ